MKNTIDSITTNTEPNEPYVQHQAPANWRSNPSILTWKDVAAMEFDDREEALEALGWVDAGDDTPETVMESIARWATRTLLSNPGRAADLIHYAKIVFVHAMAHEEPDAKARA